MTIEYKLFSSKLDSYKEPIIYTHETEILDVRAKLTMDMLCKWGIIAGEPDGEDSAGRSKLKMQSEKDLVERAVKMTALAFAEFEKNNWITHLPTLKTLEEMVKNNEL